jgi:hypothetical protein
MVRIKLELARYCEECKTKYRGEHTCSVIVAAIDYTKTPGLNSEGKPWWQLCYVCRKQIDFIKTPRHKWLGIGNGMVRHKKCDPNTYKGDK